jgi:protein-L-isoaspartate(D-aspartate) O-methyltransferase
VNTVEELRTAMVEQMISTRRLLSPSWIAAFADVPRHAFLRRFFRQSDDLSGWEAVRDTDPTATEMIYTDTTWVTQLDNDPRRWLTARDAGKPVNGIPTSSGTAPGLMALMLEALDVHDGHRVLEIGTGSGYNAALLCHRLGASLVTTVEVDPTVASAARDGLNLSGYQPTIIVADGADGHPRSVPYDRLIATCSVPTIPPAWVEQIRPGGVILTSLYRDLGGGPLIRLHVAEAGHAEGRFLPDYGDLMPLHAYPPADAARRLDAAVANDESDTRETSLGPDVLDDPDFGMVLALQLPSVTSIGFDPATGPQRWLLADDGSCACLAETTGAVSQHGSRRLWDEVEAAHRWWLDAGSPSRDRFGLTVAGSRQWVWLDNHDRRLPESRQA